MWLGLDPGTVTATFLTLAFAQLWHVFNMRAQGPAGMRNEITRNRWVWASLALCSALLVAPPYIPPLAEVLGLVPPEPRCGLSSLMSVAPRSAQALCLFRPAA